MSPITSLEHVASSPFANVSHTTQLKTTTRVAMRLASDNIEIISINICFL